MNEDIQHLKILSIFHYVLAGILVLGGCCPSMYVFLGVGMLTGGMNQPGHSNPPPMMGVFMIVMGLVFMLIPWGMAVAIGIAGRRLSEQRSYIYCMVCAGISCLFMPIGTALGVFSIVVLMRPSVKALFEGEGRG